ncbi:MAG: NAD(P)-binding domain-containing protein, partial [Flavisolibacter sp.]|nr:NAD(P)-binding domain-containing protein [Flavisolibacter sp.]
MQANTTIAIIGASGNMGSSIAKGLAKGAYRLLLCANDLSKVQTVVNEIKSNHAATDIEAIDCTKNASWEADIIILAVPYAAEKELAEKIKEVANQKIVISIANPLNEAYNGLVTPPDSSAAEELQKLLPHSKVVKAFNTTFAADFVQPVIDGKQVDAFIAGNDESAVNTVSELVK